MIAAIILASILGQSFFLFKTVRALAKRSNAQDATSVRGFTPIGYKRARLVSDEADELFSGVSHLGREYGLDSVRAPGTPGFYSYFKWEDAKAHVQEGNVFLEVFSSGEIALHQLGSIAERQRVLQLLVGECGECRLRQASYWTYNPRANSLFRWEFYCLSCKDELGLSARPLPELQEKLRAHSPTLIVGTLEATEWGGAFVPTRIGAQDGSV